MILPDIHLRSFLLVRARGVSLKVLSRDAQEAGIFPKVTEPQVASMTQKFSDPTIAVRMVDAWGGVTDVRVKPNGTDGAHESLRHQHPLEVIQ